MQRYSKPLEQKCEDDRDKNLFFREYFRRLILEIEF